MLSLWLRLGVQMMNSTVVDNKALRLETPAMRDLVERGEQYEPLPSAEVRMPNTTEQYGDLTPYTFITDVDEGHGGGIAAVLTAVRHHTIAEIIFQHLEVTGNEASVGGTSTRCLLPLWTAVFAGGFSVHMAGHYWLNTEKLSCFPSVYGLDTCQIFGLHNVTITKNRALYAGGIFSTQPAGIEVSCSPGEKFRMRTNTSVNPDDGSVDLTPFCLNMTANEISDGARIEGSQAGSKAAYLSVKGLDGSQLKQVASGDSLALPCKKGSDPCHSSKLRIIVQDIFYQTITRGIDDASLRLTLVSNNIVGDLRYTAVEGVAVINNTMAWGVGISSNVTIESESNPGVRLVLSFSTRECRPGERQQDETCKSCPSEQYGFDPSLDCRGCEDNAKCAGGAALVPSDGYWHSSPFSPCIHKCVHPDACSYPGRERVLTEFYENPSRVDENLEAVEEYVRRGSPMPTFPEYPQCAEGYEGILCGSCQYGYGHSYTDAVVLRRSARDNALIYLHLCRSPGDRS